MGIYIERKHEVSIFAHFPVLIAGMSLPSGPLI